MDRKEIETLLHCDNTILSVSAMSWCDADECKSVKQNAGQRKSLIEVAIEEAMALMPNAGVTGAELAERPR